MEAMGRLGGRHRPRVQQSADRHGVRDRARPAPSAPDDPARKHLREIERVGERGAALARQLLAFSGRQVLQPKLVQLNTC